jgi:hypothetical protein
MPFTNGVVIQPMMPERNASISKISQGSIYSQLFAGTSQPFPGFKRILRQLFLFDNGNCPTVNRLKLFKAKPAVGF